MTSLLRGMVVMLAAGTLAVLARPAGAEDRSPLFVDVPPTRTASAGDAPTTVAAAPVAAPATAAAPAGPLSVRGARVQATDTGRTVVVELSQEPKGHKYFTLPSPPRIVVDLSGPVADAPAAEQRFPTDDSLVTRVRAAPFQGKLRVVFDLREPATVASVTPSGRELKAVIATQPAKATPPAESATAVAAAAKPATAPAAPATEKTAAAGSVERIEAPAEATLARAERPAAEP
ncbi:MAG TPA: AMIN domain-containing protein, partial [Candidatus Limnocylindria bacterium]|nr:AMIN domain-containing protein [Candidatus Limnocylindria bacterium]